MIGGDGDGDGDGDGGLTHGWSGASTLEAFTEDR